MENPYELLYMRRCGDEWAQRELIRQYTPLVMSEYHRIVGNYASLKIYKEDFMQEGALAIIVAAESYREDRGTVWFTFLCTVIRRRLVTLMRHLNAKTNVRMHETVTIDSVVAEAEIVYDTLRDPDPLHEPEFHFYYKEAKDRYLKAKCALSKEDRYLLEVFEKTGSYRQAAEKVGITYKACDGRIQRIRRKLKNAILDNDHK